ncbi:hypothetical protein SAMN05428967_3798 [Phyllobacterium sp. YR620]|nr:hypothetical protein SAMN05428967_3798 [Phyllobacterium sp. YR620]
MHYLQMWRYRSICLYRLRLMEQTGLARVPSLNHYSFTVLMTTSAADMFSGGSIFYLLTAMALIVGAWLFFILRQHMR